MTPTAKEVGDAWGRLFGLAVDACQSHHAEHCDCGDEPATIGREIGGRTPRITDRPPRDPAGAPEHGDFTLTPAQRCEGSWTGTKGEVRVNYAATAITVFPPPPMHAMPADAVLAPQSYAAAATPNQAAPGVNDIVVSLNPTVGKGLFVGRLGPATGAPPQVPVLIYLDDVI